MFVDNGFESPLLTEVILAPLYKSTISWPVWDSETGSSQPIGNDESQHIRAYFSLDPREKKREL